MALHYERISNINMQPKYCISRLNNGDYICVILLPMLNKIMRWLLWEATEVSALLEFVLHLSKQLHALLPH